MLLYEEMELTRRLLYDVLDKNDIVSVLKLSQALDKLIVRYYLETSNNR